MPVQPWEVCFATFAYVAFILKIINLDFSEGTLNHTENEKHIFGLDIVALSSFSTVIVINSVSVKPFYTLSIYEGVGLLLILVSSFKDILRMGWKINLQNTFISLICWIPFKDVSFVYRTFCFLILFEILSGVYLMQKIPSLARPTNKTCSAVVMLSVLTVVVFHVIFSN